MKQACVDAITQTLGRQPKADELKNIEDRIKEAVRQVSRTNAKNGKGGIPDAETYKQAADLVARRVVHDVFKKRQRLAQNAIAINNVTETLNRNVPLAEQTPQNLAQFIFAGRKVSDGKEIDVVSAEELATGAYQDWTRQLTAEITAAGDDVQKFFNVFDPRMASPISCSCLKKSMVRTLATPRLKKLLRFGAMSLRAPGRK